MKRILSIQLLLVALFLTGCSPENETLDKDLQIETAGLRSQTCGFTESQLGNALVIPDTDVITVQGFTEAAVIEALESIDTTKRAVFFPSGIYHIPLHVTSNGKLTSRTVLNFNDISDIEIFGEPGTVLRLNYSDIDPSLLTKVNARLITISNSSNIYIHDLDLKGTFNFADSEGAPGVSNEDSGVFIRNSDNIHLFDMSCSNLAGDGINIGAMRNRTTSNIFTRNVTIDNTNRNGITIAGRGETNNIFISNCTFGRKIRSQQIDFEPLKYSVVNNVQIENSTFENLIPSSKASRQGAITALSRVGNGINCVLIKNNIIRNDVVIARSCSNFVVEGNTEIPSMLIRNNSNNITVRNNDFNINVAEALDRDRHIAGVIVAANPLSLVGASQSVAYAEPTDVDFSDNVVLLNANKTDVRAAFVIRNADAVQAKFNTIQFSQPSVDNIGFYTKFNKRNNSQSTLDDMEFDHCDNSFVGISDEDLIVTVDVNSDDDSVLITSCK